MLIELLVQACPPQGFPFFGLPPSMLAQLSLQHLQPQVALLTLDAPSARAADLVSPSCFLRPAYAVLLCSDCE